MYIVCKMQLPVAVKILLGIEINTQILSLFYCQLQLLGTIMIVRHGHNITYDILSDRIFSHGRSTLFTLGYK